MKIIIVFMLLVSFVSLNSRVNEVILSKNAIENFYKRLNIKTNTKVYIYNAKDCDCHDENYIKKLSYILANNKKSVLLYISDSRIIPKSINSIPQKKIIFLKTNQVNESKILKYELSSIKKNKNNYLLVEVEL